MNKKNDYFVEQKNWNDVKNIIETEIIKGIEISHIPFIQEGLES